MDLRSFQALTLRSYLKGSIKYRFLCFFQNGNTNPSTKSRNFGQFYSVLCGFSNEDDLTLQKFMNSVWSWVIQSFLKRCWQLRFYQKFKQLDFLSNYTPWNNSHQFSIFRIKTTTCGKRRSVKFCILWELIGDIHENTFSPLFSIQWHAFCLVFSVIDETLTIYEYYWLEFYTRYLLILWSAV